MRIKKITIVNSVTKLVYHNTILDGDDKNWRRNLVE